MNTIIRTAQRQDQDALIRLFTAHATFEGHELAISGQLKALNNLEQHPCKIYVLVNQHNVIGYFSVIKQFSTWNMSHYLYLDCLYIDKEKRGQGLGVLCLTFIRQLAKDMQVNEIQWQTPNSNERAIYFYQKQGALSKNKVRFFDAV